MIIDTKIKSMNEAYFGPDAIESMQKQFSILRKKIIGKPFSVSLSQDKELLKFNRIVEKTFGYTTFSLSINADTSLNAWALTMGMYQNDEERAKLLKALRAGKAGFRFDTAGDVVGMVSFNLGIINATEFTDEELIAIMLHEIGHNFFVSVMYGDSAFGISHKLIKVLKSINKKILDRISSGKDISLDDIKEDVEDSIDKVSFVKSLIGRLAEPISMVTSAIKRRFNKVAKLFSHEAVEDNFKGRLEGYTNEKFADTFAAMYGYGTYLHSALMKFDDYYANMRTTKQSTNPTVIAYNVFKRNLSDILAYIMGVKDEHPDGLTRIKVSTDYLKKEIAREGIDPKVKAMLVDQLDQLNRLIDDYINFPVEEDKIKIARTYYTMLYNKFGGDRREQDADNPALFDYIDKRYKEELNK